MAANAVDERGNTRFHKTASCFVQAQFSDLSAIPDDVLASEYHRRIALRRNKNGAGSGRPRVIHACSDCGAQMSARELRGHACQTILERRRRKMIERRVTRHIGWAHDVARQAIRRLPPCIELSDLEQVASIALMDCAASYSTTPGPGYDRPTPFRTFAWKSVYYGCLMSVRGRVYRDSTHEPLTDRAVGPEELQQQAERSQVFDALAEMIQELPPIQAAVLALRYFQDLSIAEAAKELQISEGWASQQHVAGLMALKEALVEKGVNKIKDCL